MKLLLFIAVIPLLFVFETSGGTALDDTCRLPPAVGSCKMAVPRWYFNNNTGQCTQFIYGGCHGNANNFYTKEDCRKKCSLTVCQLMQLLFVSVPGDIFTPKCKADGRFEELQCWTSKNYCFCVNSNGTEVAGTRLYGANKPNCKNLSSCDNYKCSAPYSTCRVVSGKPQCQCSLACPFIYMPVCGTDGKTYANDCVMKADACRQNRMVSVAKQGDCEGPCIKAMKKALGPIILVMGKPVPIKPNPYIPTCDQEGFFTSKQCNKTSGECWCSNRLGKELLDTRKQSGQAVKCDDKCKAVKCSKPYARCSVVKDQAKCDCPLAVTMIYFPVCGTDGQTYASEGVMQAQACQQNKMIAVAKVGKCGDDPCKDVQCSRPYAKCRVINNTPQCQCQQICTREYAPVCGNDGKTYGNLCMMTSKACSQNQTIIVAGRGKCGAQCKNFDCSAQPYSQCGLVSGKPQCKCQLACTREYFPVCGSDGKTYGNLCTLKATACVSKNMISVAKLGQCDVDLCKNIPCFRPYAKCQVISNKPQCLCQRFCTYEYAPVCGSDGKTYANPCMMTSRACLANKTITEAKEGECEENACKDHDCSSKPYQQCRVASGKPQCQCQLACTRHLAPVCGSDGKSYDNLCMLKAHACESGKMITVTRNGNCVKAVPVKLFLQPHDEKSQSQHSQKSSSNNGAIVGLSVFAALCVIAVVVVVVWTKRRAMSKYGRCEDTTQLHMST